LLFNFAVVQCVDAIFVLGVITLLASVVCVVAFSKGWLFTGLSALSLVHLCVFVGNALWLGMFPIAFVGADGWWWNMTASSLTSSGQDTSWFG